MILVSLHVTTQQPVPLILRSGENDRSQFPSPMPIGLVNRAPGKGKGQGLGAWQCRGAATSSGRLETGCYTCGMWSLCLREVVETEEHSFDP